MSLNKPGIQLLATVLAIFCVFRLTAVNAQVIDVLAISPPILPSRHITVGQFESAKVGVYNRCPLPVDIEIHVSPYPPDGLAGPDYAPYTIPMTLPGEGFQYGDVVVQPTAQGLAHADIEIVPAAVQRQTHACFAPGQDLLLASVGVFSTLNGAIRNVFPVKFKGPSHSASREETGIKPLGDRVVVEPSDARLLPARPRDIVQIAAANDCATAQKTTGEIRVVGSSEDPTPFGFELDPGQREVVSIVFTGPGVPLTADEFWVLLRPVIAEKDAPPRCLGDNIKVAIIYKP